MSADTHVCPECRDGKHRNCEGTAWSDETDSPTSCACVGRGHASRSHPTRDEVRSSGWSGAEQQFQ